MAVSAALRGMTTLDQDVTPALIIGVHLVLNVGLGFMPTPLLTSALGSLPVHLYTHGSAILNTLQQVAAAAGTALFITVMSTGAAAAVASGEGAVAAQAQGLRTAFVCGAVISLFAVAMAWLVKRPADHGGAAADGPAAEADTGVRTRRRPRGRADPAPERPGARAAPEVRAPGEGRGGVPLMLPIVRRHGPRV